MLFYYMKYSEIDSLENHKKIVATRCHIFKLKCTIFDFGCDSATDSAGELTALPQTL